MLREPSNPATASARPNVRYPSRSNQVIPPCSWTWRRRRTASSASKSPSKRRRPPAEPRLWEELGASLLDRYLVGADASYLDEALAAFDRSLELGSESAGLHRDVGAQAAKQGVDALYILGAEATPFGEGAKAFGMPGEDVHDVMDGGELADMLAGELRAGDAVLFKASRAVGLEGVAGDVIERLLSRAAV